MFIDNQLNNLEKELSPDSEAIAKIKHKQEYVLDRINLSRQTIINLWESLTTSLLVF
ncbi:MAG: hypothetical protein F6K22_19695 [Okeania sp. SIO2F4]|uniref:hypothetical protein n=1 Tax=Okeania sp. SIO2F4 TaxID=2607790 RepID=UPI00142B4709|nr:hypothetical protein [Okeania sp. SIO2F4]NES04861.1 hypothetical protein [Okeania sp. SIO2F4]